MESKFIPPKKQNAAMPPSVETILLKHATIISCNLVGFPCQVEIFSHPTIERKPMFRISADLNVVQSNMIIYTYLKEFNVWYLAAHEQKAGIGKFTAFENLVTAVFDFSMYWQTFASIYRNRSTDIVNLCRMVNQKIAEEILKG